MEKGTSVKIYINKRRHEIVGPPPKGGFLPVRIPLAGAVATLSDTGPDRHATLTRVAVLGVFALAAKKDKGVLHLTIRNGDQYLVEEIPRKQARQAHELVAAIRAANPDLRQDV